ncbi:hypothetical protein G6L63_09580 [Agrobacterium vitis]|uniref:hypothetical protein n=1 Tax=Agrobacterium vitis TaxID=373 RepID=UPI000A967C24|nr:hypothetical protein [Agrobacterium vitis]MUZ98804.1 hypothetical protein [Agrobacterium vitis]MVA28869.1 hypothetical protein [Agrobacterium vitis]NOJ34010.1 hypothetical protein [Agrobacterium vitis]NSZ48161.1 hypothetical protein [Agrobacterium vitis]UJL72756.1 hypothetical protein AVCG412_07950 [Agrobacterium vitis]
MSMHLVAKVSAAYILAVVVSAAGHVAFQGPPIKFAGQTQEVGILTASAQQ